MQQVDHRSPDHFESVIRSVLDPLIARARASPQLEDWAPLARKNWRDNPITKEFCRRYSRSGRAADALWYEALQRYAGFNESEMALLNGSWRALRSQAMSDVKAAFDETALRAWAQAELSRPVELFRQAPIDLKHEAARGLTASKWEGDPHFNSFVRRFGDGSSWYHTIQVYFQLSDADRDLIEFVGREGAWRAASLRNRRYSHEELLSWARKTLMPLLMHARETGSALDWAALAPARWLNDRVARAFCYAYSPLKERHDIAGALATVFGLEPAEVERLRSSGTEMKGTIRSIRHRHSLREPVEMFVSEELQPLVKQARESPAGQYIRAWDRLRAAHWTGHPCFRSFCLLHSAQSSPEAWVDALSSACQLAFEEQYLVRRILPALAAVQTRSLRPTVVSVRTDSLNSNALAEGPTLREALEETQSRVIIPRGNSSILGFGYVLDRRGERKRASEAQKTRARIATTVRERQPFDLIAEELVHKRHLMLPAQTTELGLRFLIQHVGVEPSFGWPQRILSAASGPGTLYNAVNKLSGYITSRGLSVPEVIDLDESEVVLSKSANPNRLLGRVESFPGQMDPFDAIECSSFGALSEAGRRDFLLEAGRRAPLNCLLWLKLDRAYFHSDFASVLQAAGFEPFLPVNTELLLVPTDSETSKIPGACYRARFVFATKRARADEDRLTSLHSDGIFRIQRSPTKPARPTDPPKA